MCCWGGVNSPPFFYVSVLSRGGRCYKLLHYMFVFSTIPITLSIIFMMGLKYGFLNIMVIQLNIICLSVFLTEFVLSKKSNKNIFKNHK